MSDAIKIRTEATNGDHRRLVVAQFDGREHRDKIDTDSATSRARFIKSISAALSVDAATLEHLHGEITRHAEAADEAKEKNSDIPITAAKPKIIAETIDIRSPAGRTDASNARRFVAQHGNDLRYCDAFGRWFVYDGKHFATDALLRVDALGKETAKAIWQEAANSLPDVGGDVATEILRHAKASSSARGIENMIRLARSDTKISVSPEQLDCNPWLLNCQNGIVDLKTGKLLPHDRKHLLTKIATVDYLIGAEGESPLWDQTVDRIFGGDVELIGYLQRYLGSAITATVVENILAIFHGAGSNGKSMFVEVLLDVLGDYADKGAADLLLATKGERHPTEKADLVGKRLIFCVETDEGRRLHESLTKELTGGDRIKARFMRENFFTFVPTHSIVLVTNHKPRVYGTDNGLWRRIRSIPFEQSFWDADRGETGPAELRADKQLREKLRGEYGGILRWLVDGCLAWQRDGLGEPQAVQKATANYKTDQDVIGKFFYECCVFGEGNEQKASDVRARYESWCRDNGEKAANSTRFGNALSDRGVSKRRSNGVWYMGVALL